MEVWGSPVLVLGSKLFLVRVTGSYVFNPSPQELRQEDHDFEASLGFIVSSRPAEYILSETDPVSKIKPNEVLRRGLSGGDGRELQLPACGVSAP